MDQRAAQVWARLWLRLAIVLLLVGLLPAAILMVLPGFIDPLIPFLLSLTVAPIGAAALLIGLVIWAIWRIRRVSADAGEH